MADNKSLIDIQHSALVDIDKITSEIEKEKLLNGPDRDKAVDDVFQMFNRSDAQLSLESPEQSLIVRQHGCLAIFSVTNYNREFLHEGKIYVYRKGNGIWRKEDDIYSPKPVEGGYFGHHFCVDPKGEFLVVLEEHSLQLRVFYRSISGWRLSQSINVKDQIDKDIDLSSFEDNVHYRFELKSGRFIVSLYDIVKKSPN